MNTEQVRRLIEDLYQLDADQLDAELARRVPSELMHLFEFFGRQLQHVTEEDVPVSHQLTILAALGYIIGRESESGPIPNNLFRMPRAAA